MKERMLITNNNFPFRILAENLGVEDAVELCERLNREEKAREGNSLQTIFYGFQFVKEIEEIDSLKIWGKN